jgi:hypothetical protein
MKAKITAEEKAEIIKMKERGMTDNGIYLKIAGKITPQRINKIYKRYLQVKK